MSDLRTISPDELLELSEIPEGLRAVVFSPSGPLQSLPYEKLLTKLIAADLAKPTKSAVDADLAHPAGSVALVFGDAVSAQNGWYRKVGAAGAGSWQQFEELARSVRLAAEAAAAQAAATGAAQVALAQAQAELATGAAAQAAADAATLAIVSTAEFPEYTFATLPDPVTAARPLALLLDGPNPSEASGAGTGIIIYSNRTNWLRLNDSVRVNNLIADFFVDSTSGLDSNDGLKTETAKQTIAAGQTLINAFGANATLALVVGSYWPETLTLTNRVNARVSKIGSGDLPVLDGAGPVTETWTRHDAATFPNAWNISATQNWNVNQARMMIWEDGVMLKRVGSIALCNAEAGTYFSPSDNAFLGVPNNIVYLHPTGSGNPNSNGRFYERTRLLHVINGAFGPAGGQVVTGVVTGRQGHNDGSLVLGKDSIIDGCVAFDGHKHNALQESGICRNSGFINGQPEVNYLHVFYTTDGAGLNAEYENAVFVGQVNGGRGTAGVYCHDNGGSSHTNLRVNSTLFANVSAAVASSAVNTASRGVYVENGTSAFNEIYSDSVSFSHWLINGQAGNNSFDAPGSRTISQFAGFIREASNPSNGFLRAFANFGNVEMTQSTLVMHRLRRVFLRDGGTGTFGMNRNIIVIDALTAGNAVTFQARTADLGTINNNVYFIRGAGNTKANFRFIVDGTERTIAQWQALGYDANSRFLDESDIAFSALFEGSPQLGDFRLRDTVTLTLPDGTPIRTLGATEHWNFATKSVVPSAPARWPSVPKTRAQAEAFAKGQFDLYPLLAPVWTGSLASQTFTEDTGEKTYNVSSLVALAGTVTYSLVSPPAGVSINSATGVISFDTAVTAVQAGTIITVRAANAASLALTADATLSLTIAAFAQPAEVKAIGPVAKITTTVSSFNVTAPATDAGDVILLMAWVNHAVTATAPANFTLVRTAAGVTNEIARLYVWQWDGTGTRPNGNAQTITLSGSAQFHMGVMFACSGSGIGNSGAYGPTQGNNHQSPSYTVSPGSLAFHVWSARTGYTITATYTGATPDQTTLTPPDIEGRFNDSADTNVRGFIQTVACPLPATVNRMTVNGGSFAFFGGVSFEVRGPTP